jgi:enamine deaminase RidA (YjgF/YER057c/UK114 family)
MNSTANGTTLSHPTNSRREAVISRHALKDWFAQDVAWHGAMVAAGVDEIFIRGQTGSALDGSFMAGPGRRPEDAAAQADLALANLATLLDDAGSGMDEVCKITVYISDRAYRSAVYPVIGRHFRGIHPVSTGIIMPGFARPETLFEIDDHVRRRQGEPHRRLRPYHSNAIRYGFGRQALDCDFCMAVCSGPQVTRANRHGPERGDAWCGRSGGAGRAGHGQRRGAFE